MSTCSGAYQHLSRVFSTLRSSLTLLVLTHHSRALHTSFVCVAQLMALASHLEAASTSSTEAHPAAIRGNSSTKPASAPPTATSASSSPALPATSASASGRAFVVAAERLLAFAQPLLDAPSSNSAPCPPPEADEDTEAVTSTRGEEAVKRAQSRSAQKELRRIMSDLRRHWMVRSESFIASTLHGCNLRTAEGVHEFTLAHASRRSVHMLFFAANSFHFSLHRSLSGRP